MKKVIGYRLAVIGLAVIGLVAITGCRDGRITVFDSSDNSTTTDSHDTVTVATNSASTNAASMFTLGTYVVPEHKERSILKMEGSK